MHLGAVSYKSRKAPSPVSILVKVDVDRWVPNDVHKMVGLLQAAYQLKPTPFFPDNKAKNNAFQ